MSEIHDTQIGRRHTFYCCWRGSIVHISLAVHYPFYVYSRLYPFSLLPVQCLTPESIPALTSSLIEHALAAHSPIEITRPCCEGCARLGALSSPRQDNFFFSLFLIRPLPLALFFLTDLGRSCTTLRALLTYRK